MSKLIDLIKKVLSNKEIISYLIFGVLTTVLNIIVFMVFVRFLNIEENVANFIAIIVSILFAYITNSLYVFKSKLKWAEFIKFILGRTFTLVVELVGFFILFNLIHIPDLISKVLITVIVVILNYFISKYFAFKK